MLALFTPKLLSDAAASFGAAASVLGEVWADTPRVARASPMENNGCVVLFPSNEGFRINLQDNSIKELTKEESLSFGEKVNQGLHAAGGALAQGASLLGGALPGGAVISAAVSSVGNLAGGAGGGAAAASYAKNAKTVFEIQDQKTDTELDLPDGEFELGFVITRKAASGLKDTLKTQVRIGFSIENRVLKTKHDTAKNSVGNIR